MKRPDGKLLVILVGAFVLMWLGLRYLLPVLLPFLLGFGLAIAAEPVVRRLHTRLHLPRTMAAGVGVSLALVLLLSLLVLMAALLVHQIRSLSAILPDLEHTAVSGLSALQTYLLRLSEKLPAMFSEPVSRSVQELFSSGTVLVDQVAKKLPAFASAVFSHVPGSALMVGTGILSAYMVSARLPKLRRWLHRTEWYERMQTWRPALGKIRSALGGWLKAQLMLSLMSFGIVTTGLWILRIPYAPVWGLLIALVDAVPILGTGTVLLPWAFVCLVRQQKLQALGILVIYVASAIARSLLEPRMVGRQLGLDPLLTLVALYAGFQLWGFAGMLFAPLLCVAAGEVGKLHLQQGIDKIG